MKKYTCFLGPLLVIIYLINFVGLSSAQTTVTGITPSAAANLLLGTGVTISGVSFTGSTQQLAEFNYGSSEIGINHGIALTTGQYNFITGNNTSDVGNQMNLSSPTGITDADLASLAGVSIGATKNPVFLEFDFTTTGTTVQFEYVFACEEYNRYAPNAINGCSLSSFNDVFGFFISGPGITGPFTGGTAMNIATLPSSTTPVSVNTVNYCFNSSYYINNCYGITPCAGTYSPTLDPSHLPFPYNGKTVVLTAKANVSCAPGATYHIKLAITNISDDLLDAAVFIKANSLSSNFVLGPIIASPVTVCEGDPFVLTTTNNSSWNYAWSDGQTGMGLNSITTSASLGTSSYSVSVTNTNGCQLTQNVNVNVHPIANDPPYINGYNNTGLYDLYVQAGDEICFDIPTFDAANESVSISYLGGISGIEVDPPTGFQQTGHYCWDTSPTDVGDHSFQVQICDGNVCGNLCQTYTFNIHVACSFCPVDKYYENRSVSTVPLPGLTKVARYIFAGTSVDPSQTDGPVIVSASETVDFKAGVNIFLEPGFTSLPGANFTAFIEPGTCISDCEECCADFGGFTPDFIPNVFTPNGDGVNDMWYIPDVDNPNCAFNAQQFELWIFNRWGSPIWHLTGTDVNPLAGSTCCPFLAPSPDSPFPYGTPTHSSIYWDGSNSGDPSSDGPYYLILELEGCGYEQSYTGTISVFRNSVLNPNPTYENATAPEGMIFPQQEEFLQESPRMDTDLSIVPNPTQNNFSVVGVTNGAPLLFNNIEIINSYSEVILKQSNYITGQTINIETLSKGLYWIKLQNQEKSYVKILIKQ